MRFLSVSACAIAIAMASWVLALPALADGPRIVERSADGRVRVEQRIIGGRTYETLLVRARHGPYRVADVRVSHRDPRGRLFFFNEDDPDTRYDHEFFLSPFGMAVRHAQTLPHRERRLSLSFTRTPSDSGQAGGAAVR